MNEDVNVNRKLFWKEERWRVAAEKRMEIGRWHRERNEVRKIWKGRSVIAIGIASYTKMYIRQPHENRKTNLKPVESEVE